MILRVHGHRDPVPIRNLPESLTVAGLLEMLQMTKALTLREDQSLADYCVHQGEDTEELPYDAPLEEFFPKGQEHVALVLPRRAGTRVKLQHHTIQIRFGKTVASVKGVQEGETLAKVLLEAILSHQIKLPKLSWLNVDYGPSMSVSIVQGKKHYNDWQNLQIGKDISPAIPLDLFVFPDSDGEPEETEAEAKKKLAEQAARREQNTNALRDKLRSLDGTLASSPSNPPSSSSPLLLLTMLVAVLSMLLSLLKVFEVL